MPHFKTIVKEPIIKRLPIKRDRTDDIQTYDVDNLYPQRMEEISRTSPIAKSCIRVFSKFIEGMGFEDENINRIKINRRGTTVRDLLRVASKSWAHNQAFATHFNYNMLGEIREITPLFFKYVRMGLADRLGRISTLAFSTNWEQDPEKIRKEVQHFPVFDPSPDTVLSQIEEAGGIRNYPGQILYFTPEPDQYPLATFDPMVDSVQSSGEIALFELANLQNGFMAGHIINYPGTFDDETDKEKVAAELREFKGARNAGTMMLVENPSLISRPLVEKLEHPNNDKLFEVTSRNVKNTIVEGFTMPKPLAVINPETGMFNKEDMINSYVYFNILTQEVRDLFEDIFQDFLEPFWRPIGAGNFKIARAEFI